MAKVVDISVRNGLIGTAVDCDYCQYRVKSYNTHLSKGPAMVVTALYLLPRNASLHAVKKLIFGYMIDENESLNRRINQTLKFLVDNKLLTKKNGTALKYFLSTDFKKALKIPVTLHDPVRLAKFKAKFAIEKMMHDAFQPGKKRGPKPKPRQLMITAEKKETSRGRGRGRSKNPREIATTGKEVGSKGVETPIPEEESMDLESPLSEVESKGLAATISKVESEDQETPISEGSSTELTAILKDVLTEDFKGESSFKIECDYAA